MEYLSDYQGQVYRYRSLLRPVASIGYSAIPHLLLEPGSDLDGRRRDFATSKPVSATTLRQFDIEFTGVSHTGEL